MTKFTPRDITKFAQKAMILKYQIDELGGILDSYGKKGGHPNMRIAIYRSLSQNRQTPQKTMGYFLDK